MQGQAFIFGSVLMLFGCSDAGTTAVTGTTASELLSAAVANAQSTHAATKACFADFQTCIDATTTADATTACQTALAACLPSGNATGDVTVPDLCSDDPPKGHGGMVCDGGMMMSRPEGGAPGDARGPDGNGGPRGSERPPLSPTGRIALATCHAQLHACLTAGSDPATCLATDHACVHAAIAADFATLCASLADRCASCSTSKRCEDLSARCAAGVPLGDAADGGTK